MTHQLTLGSLFDGSGGFPLAATRVGITPVWASEIEPFPILVSSTRFPNMTHLGDVTSINGAKIEPVDIITFGSPCQDLSVAGRRGGLDGARSGLFFHAVRIIEEMRHATHGRYPRYAIWENVPGAFSSHHGHDFATVLTSLIHIAQPQAPDLCVPGKGWPKAGLVMAGGCSISWRVLDAQHFGVPQRRRRIFLIADFAGQRAGNILFEPESLPRNLEEGGPQEQNHAPDPAQRPPRGSVGPIALNHHPNDGRITLESADVSQTLTSRMGTGGGNVPLVLDKPAFALNSVHEGRNPGGRFGFPATVSKTLDLRGGDPACNQGGMVILDKDAIYAASKADHFVRATPNQAGALMASDYKSPPIIGSTHLRPRKLTPTECARLQGFPDDWCDNIAITNPTPSQLRRWTRVWARWNTLRSTKARTPQQVATWLANPNRDASQYKMWGNGIALPVATHVLDRLAAHHTMTDQGL